MTELSLPGNNQLYNRICESYHGLDDARPAGARRYVESWRSWRRIWRNVPYKPVIRQIIIVIRLLRSPDSQTQARRCAMWRSSLRSRVRRSGGAKSSPLDSGRHHTAPGKSSKTQSCLDTMMTEEFTVCARLPYRYLLESNRIRTPRLLMNRCFQLLHGI